MGENLKYTPSKKIVKKLQGTFGYQKTPVISYVVFLSIFQSLVWLTNYVNLMQNNNILFRQNFVKILLIIRWRPNSQLWRLWIQTGFWISNHASIVRLFEIEQICGWKNGSRKKHRLGYIGCIHLWEKLRLQWKWIKSLQIRIHLETRPLIWHALHLSDYWNHTT